MNRHEDFRTLRDWVIENIEKDLESFTWPIIKKATEKNILKAIEQNKDAEKGSCKEMELNTIKEDLEIFRIIKQMEKRE